MNTTFRALDPKDILAESTADGHVVCVTDQMVRVGVGDQVRLDVEIANIRRIEFDIERDRPATLVIVPDAPSDEPQVIMVQPEDYAGVGSALALIGQRMAGR